MYKTVIRKCFTIKHDLIKGRDVPETRRQNVLIKIVVDFLNNN